MMQLDLCGDKLIDGPTPEVLANALRRAAQQDEFFAILSEFDFRFLQVAGDYADGFVLEYQDGGLDHHFQSVNEQLDMDTVVQVFNYFLHRDQRWRTELQWRRISV